jgi:hypothetical protein
MRQLLPVHHSERLGQRYDEREHRPLGERTGVWAGRWLSSRVTIV